MHYEYIVSGSSSSWIHWRRYFDFNQLDKKGTATYTLKATPQKTIGKLLYHKNLRNIEFQ
jgi:hypothetical protein